MPSETYFFYDENSDNNKKFKKFMKLLDSAIQWERQNNPEVFGNSNEFHFTTKSNEFMDQLAKDFSESISDFPKWCYAVFLVGENAYIDSTAYRRKGHVEYLSEIKSTYYSINFDNKTIATTLLSKRPWIVYERIKHVFDKIGFVYS